MLIGNFHQDCDTSVVSIKILCLFPLVGFQTNKPFFTVFNLIVHLIMEFCIIFLYQLLPQYYLYRNRLFHQCDVFSLVLRSQFVPHIDDRADCQITSVRMCLPDWSSHCNIPVLAKATTVNQKLMRRYWPAKFNRSTPFSWIHSYIFGHGVWRCNFC